MTTRLASATPYSNEGCHAIRSGRAVGMVGCIRPKSCLLALHDWENSLAEAYQLYFPTSAHNCEAVSGPGRRLLRALIGTGPSVVSQHFQTSIIWPTFSSMT